MIKSLYTAAFFLLAIALLPSCKKCYTCVDTCSICLLKDSLQHVLDSRSICSDSSWYSAKKDSLVAAGYSCTNSPAQYHDDFCVNTKDATNQYLLYHEGDGAFTCSPK